MNLILLNKGLLGVLHVGGGIGAELERLLSFRIHRTYGGYVMGRVSCLVSLPIVVDHLKSGAWNRYTVRINSSSHVLLLLLLLLHHRVCLHHRTGLLVG